MYKKRTPWRVESSIKLFTIHHDSVRILGNKKEWVTTILPQSPPLCETLSFAPGVNVKVH